MPSPLISLCVCIRICADKCYCMQVEGRGYCRYVSAFNSPALFLGLNSHCQACIKHLHLVSYLEDKLLLTWTSKFKCIYLLHTTWYFEICVTGRMIKSKISICITFWIYHLFFCGKDLYNPLLSIPNIKHFVLMCSCHSFQ